MCPPVPSRMRLPTRETGSGASDLLARPIEYREIAGKYDLLDNREIRGLTVEQTCFTTMAAALATVEGQLAPTTIWPPRPSPSHTRDQPPSVSSQTSIASMRVGYAFPSCEGIALITWTLSSSSGVANWIVRECGVGVRSDCQAE